MDGWKEWRSTGDTLRFGKRINCRIAWRRVVLPILPCPRTISFNARHSSHSSRSSFKNFCISSLVLRPLGMLSRSSFPAPISLHIEFRSTNHWKSALDISKYNCNDEGKESTRYVLERSHIRWYLLRNTYGTPLRSLKLQERGFETKNASIFHINSFVTLDNNGPTHPLRNPKFQGISEKYFVTELNSSISKNHYSS